MTAGRWPMTSRVRACSVSALCTFRPEPVSGATDKSIGSRTSHVLGATSSGDCSADQICSAFGFRFVTFGVLASMVLVRSRSCSLTSGPSFQSLMSMLAKVTLQRFGNSTGRALVFERSRQEASHSRWESMAIKASRIGSPKPHERQGHMVVSWLNGLVVRRQPSSWYRTVTVACRPLPAMFSTIGSRATRYLRPYPFDGSSS